MAKLFNNKYVRHPIAKPHQKDVFAIVLEKLQHRINTEIEDPNGQFNANDLMRLQKEMYG